MSASEKKTVPIEDTPLQPALDELALLRTSFQAALAQYASQMEHELDALSQRIGAVGERKRVPHHHAHSLRDILLVLRSLEVQPGKGRRRALQKIEGTVEELRRLVEGLE